MLHTKKVHRVTSGWDVGGRLCGRSVLVVDDDANVLRLVARILARAGATIYEARAAAGAFEILRSLRPQLLVSDIDMPLESGISLVRRFRALERQIGGGMPAIALTGDSNPAVREEAMCAGFNEYLTKPFVPSELVAVSGALLKVEGRALARVHEKDS